MNKPWSTRRFFAQRSKNHALEKLEAFQKGSDPVMILHASWSDIIRVISDKQNGHVPFTSQPYPKSQYLLKFLRSILDCQNVFFFLRGLVFRGCWMFGGQYEESWGIWRLFETSRNWLRMHIAFRERNKWQVKVWQVNFPILWWGAEEPGLMYFPTKGGAKEPQNPQNHRVVDNFLSWQAEKIRGESSSFRMIPKRQQLTCHIT